MLHNRSVSFAGDHATAQNMNVLRSGHHQNENLIHQGNSLNSLRSRNSNIDTLFSAKKPMNTLSKTPSGKMASTRRRAFGDISNKKTKNEFGKDSSSTTKQKPRTINILKHRSNSLLPRAIRNVPTPQNTQIAILPVKSKSSSLRGGRLNQGICDENSFSESERSSIFSQHHSLSVEPADMKSCSPSKLQQYPDIERPAGRTWKQQLEYDLEAEEDLGSISSIESVLNTKGRVSPQDWYRKEMNFRSLCRKKDHEEDRAVREQFQVLMDRERQEVEEGIDSFYDVIDDLRIFSDSSHISECDDSQGEDLTVVDISGLDLHISDDLSLSL